MAEIQKELLNTVGFENYNWIKNTDVKAKDLECCKSYVDIFHCSNWHDGTGIFYAKCPNCKKEFNIRWHRSK